VLRWTSALGWAHAADHWRVRGRLLVLAGALGALAVVPLLAVRALAAVAAISTAIGLLHGPIIPMLDATVIDHLPRLGGDYGRLRLWGSLAFVGGALASASLVGRWSPAVIPLLLLLAALPMAPALARLPRAQAVPTETARAAWMLLTPPLRTFLATAFLLQVSSGAWTGFYAVHTARLGFADTVPGFTWGLAVVAEIALFFSGARLIDRLGPPNVIVVVLVLTAARWALTAAARSEVLVVALQLGHAITFSAFHLASVLLLSRLVPAESRTGGRALYGGIAFGLGGSAGLALAGALVDRIGTPRLFAIEAMTALLALVPALRLRRLLPSDGASQLTEAHTVRPTAK
jgi:MFS transporter, PPP family, 3-phenylpropionic acid transporter